MLQLLANEIAQNSTWSNQKHDFLLKILNII